MTATDQKPQWTHDCDRCVFHGSYGPVDVWTCRGSLGLDLIVRFSSEGSHYWCSPMGMHGAQTHEDLARGVLFALQTAFGGLGPLFESLDVEKAKGKGARS